MSAAFAVLLFASFLTIIKTQGPCGQRLPTSADKGVIYTAGYRTPGATYGDNLYCTWTLMAPVGRVVQLIWDEDFMVEYNENCQFDQIKIQDGLGQLATINGPFCGLVGPNPWTSRTRNVTIQWATNNYVQMKGFQVTYEYINPAQAKPLCPNPIQTTTNSGYAEVRNYQRNMDCRWLLTAKEGQIITANFDPVFGLSGSGQPCFGDYVSVYDGTRSTNRQLVQACGNQAPASVSSTGKEMLIVFHSDPGFSVSFNSGFRISYTFSDSSSSACPNIVAIDGQNGYIQSPGYNSVTRASTYPRNSDCKWTLQAPLGQVINLNFDPFFQLEPDGVVCRNDYVAAYDGPSAFSQRLFLGCGNVPPQRVTTSQNVAYIVFQSNAFSEFSGFKLYYTFGNPAPSTPAPTSIYRSNCFNVDPISLYSGYVSSLNYLDGGRAYQQGQECTYLLRPSSAMVRQNDYRVRVTFVEVDIQSGQIENTAQGARLICTDSITVIDGNIGNNILIQVCGNQPPIPVISNAGSATLQFKTDNAIEGKGFKLFYEFVNTNSYNQCGAVTYTTSSSGYINSPKRWDHFYKINLNCKWTIVAPAGYVVRFTFRDDFLDIQPSHLCERDRLVFFDGASVFARKIVAYCGWVADHQDFATSQNVAVVEFVTDKDFEARGFVIEWRFERRGSARSADSCPEPLITASNGEVKTKNYDEGIFYDSDLQCAWSINGNSFRSNQPLRLYFEEDIDIQYSPGCASDSLTIYEGSTQGGRELQKLCGSGWKPAPIIVPGKQAYVVFRSDGAINRHGFKLKFDAAEEPDCPKTMTSSTAGYVTSPNYNENSRAAVYPKNSNCKWDLSGGNYIEMDFSANFQVGAAGSSPNCYGDYVAIYDGASEQSTEILKACGSIRPSFLRSNGPSATVVFRSDNYNEYAGFKLNFRYVGGLPSGCPDIVTLGPQSGYIVTPGYLQGSTYTPNLNCRWIISAEAGQTIQLSFDKDFGVEQSSFNCDRDSVTIYNGISESDNELVKACGKTQPNSVSSSRNVVLVVFKSNTQIQERGFKLNYFFKQGRSAPEKAPQCTLKPQSVYDSNCIYVKPMSMYGGFIESRNFLDGTSTYEPNIDCVFTIQPSSEEMRNGNYKVFISFISIELQDGTATRVGRSNSEQLECSDSLALYDGKTVNDKLLIEVCGTARPATITSSSPFVTARFRTDNFINNPGFKFAYEFRDAGQATYCLGVTYHTEFSGSLASPKEDGTKINYRKFLDCGWTIVAPPGYTIRFTFRDNFFDLEPSINCEKDVLEVYDGPTTKSRKITAYCGFVWEKQDFGTTSNVAYIKLHTDDWNEARGFVLDFRFVRSNAGSSNLGIILPGTGGTNVNRPARSGNSESCPQNYVLGQTGMLVTKSYDSGYFYEEGLDCTWSIKAFRANERILVTFLADVDIEYSPGCQADSLVMYDGAALTDPEIVNLCGSDCVPQEICSTTDQMLIRFKTDDKFNRHGFKLKYNYSTTCVPTRKPGDLGRTGPRPISKICTQPVSLPNGGTLESPKYGTGYVSDLNCEWTLRANVGQRITLYFENFKLERSTNCFSDALEIYDGPSMNSRVITRLCGTDQVQPITSTSNTLFLRFYSNNIKDISENGFSLRYVFTGGVAQSQPNPESTSLFRKLFRFGF